MRKIIAVLTAAVLLFGTLSFTGCNEIEYDKSDTVFGVAQTTGTLLGEVSRTMPEKSNGGLRAYPIYGTNLKDASLEEKQAIYNENVLMFDYDEVKEDGSLFKSGQPLGKKIFAHTAAEGLFLEPVKANVNAVIKKVIIDPRDIGNSLTGLYAPPGEIVTIIMDDATAKRNMLVNIGYGSCRGRSVDIPVTRDYNRMPILGKSMRINKTESYVASPLGGPIYLHNESDASLKGMPYEVTIIGAIETPHFVQGMTTREEWDRLKVSPGIIFDLEVGSGVRHSMPAKYIRAKSYEDMALIAGYWKNCTDISLGIKHGVWNGDVKQHPVTMLYDPYVPAGAAVAIVGADVSIHPLSWAESAVSYDQMNTAGSWGVMHEMNHHYQGFGAGEGGEVTNNVVTSMSYMVNTDIAKSRTETQGLGGWNWVTSASHVLTTTKNRPKNSPNREVDMYQNITHAFGVPTMIEMIRKSSAQTLDNWYESVSEISGYDMSYYFNDVCHFNLTKEATNKPIFVPIASPYQIGRSVLSGGENKEVISGKSFVIPAGKQKELDLYGSMILPEGIEITNLEIVSLSSGSISEADGKYLFTPPKKADAASELRVKVSLKNIANELMKIDDITLVLSFEQSAKGVIGWIKEDAGYSNLLEAIGDNENLKIQEGEEVRYSFAGISTNVQNSITMAEGKLYFPRVGKYRLFLRGDDSALLYGGTAKDSMELKAQVDDYTPTYDKTKKQSYFDLEIADINKPFYFRVYNQNKNSVGVSRIGWIDFTSTEGGKPQEIETDGSTDEMAKEVAIIDIPSAYVYHIDAEVKFAATNPADMVYPFMKVYIANGLIQEDISGGKVTKAPSQYGSAKVDYMIDGKLSTAMHSAVNSNLFPMEIVIDFGGKKTFNTLNVLPRQGKNTAGRLKDYEIEYGVSPVNLSLLSEGTAPNTASGLQLVFPEITARYIKLTAKNHHGSESYISISELQIGRGITSSEVAPHSGTDLSYKGKWQKATDGLYLNGGMLYTNNGSMEVTFHGTDFGLFAKTSRAFGEGEIRIDKGEWQSFSQYSDTEEYGKLVFVAIDLSDTYHKVEIRAKDSKMINIDFLAFKPTLPPQPVSIGLWWIAIGILIAVACVGLGIGGFFLMKGIEKERSASERKPKITLGSNDNPRHKATIKVSEKKTASAKKPNEKSSFESQFFAPQDTSVFRVEEATFAELEKDTSKSSKKESSIKKSAVNKSPTPRDKK